MKLIRFLLLAVFILSLSACVGGGSAKSSVDDDTRIMTTAVVDGEGRLSYTGSGEFEGFALSIDDIALAGRKIYIEKSEAPYVTGGFVAVSDRYSVRFTDSTVSVENLYDAEVTIPYSSSALTAEGGAAADAVACSIVGDTVVPSQTTAGAGAYVTAGVDFPLTVFVGVLKQIAVDDNDGTIIVKSVSYKAAQDAGDNLQDPAAKFHPDVVRGIKYVQAGEKVMLGVSTEALGFSVVSSSWSIASKPAGSSASLTVSGSDAQFIPDTNGIYNIQLDLTGTGGIETTRNINIQAQSYSYNSSTGGAACSLCHDGGVESASYKDIYGRSLLRDLITPWTASAHSGTFARVAASADSTCFQCHTTGFLFADRDENNTDDHPEADGYDDSIADWSAPAAGDAHLRGVGCEACHGPSTISSASFMQTHYNEASITSGTCLSCHESGSTAGHFFDYSTTHDDSYTLAGGAVSSNTQCAKCHTGEGMLGRIFDADINQSNRGSLHGITCSVCHDPHGESSNNAQLRLSGDYSIELTDSTKTVAAGDALACYSCHNADIQLPAIGSIPHNTQAEMYDGVGGYTYGTVISYPTSIHKYLGLTCNNCHMNRQEGITHNPLMTENTTERLAYCNASCHSGPQPAVIDGHYDKNSVMAGVRASIQQLADTINEKAGSPQGTAIEATYTTADANLSTALNRAAYNYHYITNDRSNGFHNPDYIQTLIDLSIADLANY